MKRFGFIMIAIMALIAVFAATQPAFAGGGGLFNNLSFPGATTGSCGTWQASGYGGPFAIKGNHNQTTDYSANYVVLDGHGLLLSTGSVATSPSKASVHQSPCVALN